MTDQPQRPVFEIAWTEVEPGWRVLDSDGGEVGTVRQTVGDRDVDIFEGFQIRAGRGPDRFVSFEHVIRVSPGVVQLGLTGAGIENLPEHREVPSLQIGSDSHPSEPPEQPDGDVSPFLDRHGEPPTEGSRRPLWRRMLGL
jgi:hypothetical protein